LALQLEKDSGNGSTKFKSKLGQCQNTDQRLLFQNGFALEVFQEKQQKKSRKKDAQLAEHTIQKASKVAEMSEGARVPKNPVGQKPEYSVKRLSMYFGIMLQEVMDVTKKR